MKTQAYPRIAAMILIVATPLAAAEADVVALWQFNRGAECKDASGHARDLVLRGKSRVVDTGRSGSALECFPAATDKPQGAVTAKRYADLTPTGPFTLELRFRPKPGMTDTQTAFLLDNKYYHYAKDIPQANAGYVFFLRRGGPGPREKWLPTAMLGFGDDSESYTARPVELAAGKWYHIAFTYDGLGTGRFWLDGRDIGGSTAAARRGVARARYALAVGARYGSTHVGLAGFIDQVRISKGVAVGGLSIDVGTADGRTAFLRMQKDADLQVRVTNRTGRATSRGSVRVTLGQSRDLTLPPLKPNQTHTIPTPLDTTWRPGRYQLAVVASADGGGRTFRGEQSSDIVIAPRPLPDVMPVVMWGSGDLKRLKEIGFTHHFVHVGGDRAVWSAGEVIGAERFPNVDDIRHTLNEHLAEGIGAVCHVSPGRFLTRSKATEKFLRVDRASKVRPKKNCCAAVPQVQKFGYNVGASIAQTFGRFPALQGALIHTEIRDGTNTCFHEHDRKAFEKFAGYPIPQRVVSKWGPLQASIPDFPKSRIIPDDHKLLTFYRWFWKTGDGWNPLHTQVHRGLKSAGRGDLWTFHDPAVRAPSLWSSGGQVDYLSHWTYTYPDPIKIGQTTDELFAMAAGAAGRQRVMKMTQIIWYRSQTAPKSPESPKKPEKGAHRAAWEQKDPDARFITIAPDHLREAFWSKISRPIRGIMYHGWPSLVPSASHGAYRFTNPRTAAVLSELTRTVVRPLGPTLLQIPDRPADVAILESFASQMFAHRGTWGWSHHWIADMHLILQWAQLQPAVVYDETVLRDGLDAYRVLVMPHCDILTESVARKIAQFRRKGGLLIADEHLPPSIKPDIVVPAYTRTKKADVDKAALQSRAAALRKDLDARYTRHAESSNPDVVVRLRKAGPTDYLFALNDKRTFGRYVGHHRRVMEKGLPVTATLTIRRPGAHVYDLVAHKPVPAQHTADALSFSAAFGPGAGRLFVITPRRIAAVRIGAPVKAALSRPVRLRLTVTADDKTPVDAVVPVRLTVLDPKDRPAEPSGHYAAVRGQVDVTLDLAPNDLPGPWTIRVAELASGLAAEHKFTVSR